MLNNRGQLLPTSVQPHTTDRAGSHLLEPTAYYSPLPIIALSCDDRIIDTNLAARILFRPFLDGYREQYVSDALKEVCGRVPACFLAVGAETPSAEPASPSDLALGVQTEVVPVETPGYGKGKLRFWIGNFINRGTKAGSCRALYAELISLTSMESFVSDLTEQWRHQLTWECYAISYDQILMKMGYYTDVLSRHQSALSQSSVYRVIDLGAGTGNLAGMLLENLQLKVTVVDSSRAMLERLRAKLNDHIGVDLTVIEQNAESLDQLGKDSFDGVSILLALFDMREPLAALEEAIRILRPGGVIIVTEPKRCFRKEPILEHIKSDLKEAGIFLELKEDFERVVKANQLIDPAERVGRSPLRAEDIYAILRDREFQSLTINDSHFGNCATVRGIKPQEAQ